ncbi:MAG: DUF5131 family protein [Planctomycetota bacterium]
MNKTKIDWCDYSWNPVTGCSNNCYYCYARKIYHRFGRSFKPRFHPDRLNEIDRIKKPSKIFLGSVTDLWDPMVKPEWREKVFDKCLNMEWPAIRYHQFIVLTKQPQNIKYGITISSRNNLWIGVSIEGHDMQRWIALSQKEYIKHKIISFEPTLASLDGNDLGMMDRYGYPDWIIIGALTKYDKKSMKESQEAVRQMFDNIKFWKSKGIKLPPIFFKDNCGIKNAPKEFPKEMNHR